MIKKHLFYLTFSLILSACSNDEPEAAVYMQIASVSNDRGTEYQFFSLDSRGRVISYQSAQKRESITIVYEYVSDDLIRITTRDAVVEQNGNIDILRTYQDELHLENGRAASCDGLFTMIERNKKTFEKKYRHEFNYSFQNLLNSVKWTEWRKDGKKWDEDHPCTWENFYYWENGNLVKIEDYLGNTNPAITYHLQYNNVVGAQNVLPVPMGRHQYFPLQLKGVFGSMSVNLITEIDRTDTFGNSSSTAYEYVITDGRIKNYTVMQDNIASDTYSVEWSK